MDALQRIYDNLPAEYWWWLLVMVVMLPAVPIAMRAHFHLRNWYWHRRAGREGGILPEERYAAAPGSPPPEVEWRAAVVAELVMFAVWMAVPAIIIAYNLPEWLDLALGIALLLGGIAYTLWRKFNDPPAPPDDDHLPDAEVPFDAVSGFLAAMAVIGVLLLLAWAA